MRDRDRDRDRVYAYSKIQRSRARFYAEFVRLFILNSSDMPERLADAVLCARWRCVDGILDAFVPAGSLDNFQVAVNIKAGISKKKKI